MSRLRDILSAWAIVALIATGMLAVWGLQAPRDQTPIASALACAAPGVNGATVSLPRRSGWMPDPVLVGLPDQGRGQTAYDVSEARNLERVQTARPWSATLAQGSGASLHAGRVC